MSNQEILWKPTYTQINQSQMMGYTHFINKQFGLDLDNYENLYQWSIENIDLFWDSFRKFSKIKFSKEPHQIIDDVGKMPGAVWFEGSQFNFAENLLRYRNEDTAIRFFGEDKVFRELSFNELYSQTSKMASYFKSIGIKKGDKIVGYIPNLPETVICMLASTSIGAIWSSCSPDFGVVGVLDRFEQIIPKLLIVSDGYYYKGKLINYSEKVKKVINGLNSLDGLIEINYVNTKNNYMLRIRSFDYTKDEYRKIISEASVVCEKESIQLIIDHPFEYSPPLYFSGIHYTSSYLSEVKKIDESRYFLSASCHNLEEVSIANNLNLDFIIVSPVLKSKHIKQKCLGWKDFKKISEYANMPTFALGGIKPRDLPISINNSGYGVSGITNFWKNNILD